MNAEFFTKIFIGILVFSQILPAALGYILNIMNLIILLIALIGYLLRKKFGFYVFMVWTLSQILIPLIIFVIFPLLKLEPSTGYSEALFSLNPLKLIILISVNLIISPLIQNSLIMVPLNAIIYLFIWLFVFISIIIVPLISIICLLKTKTMFLEKNISRKTLLLAVFSSIIISLIFVVGYAGIESYSGTMLEEKIEHYGCSYTYKKVLVPDYLCQFNHKLRPELVSCSSSPQSSGKLGLLKCLCNKYKDNKNKELEIEIERYCREEIGEDCTNTPSLNRLIYFEGKDYNTDTICKAH